MFLSFTIQFGPMRSPMHVGLDFAALPELKTPLTPLTVLSGANGSGKSTFIKGIYQMREALHEGRDVLGRKGRWSCSYLLPKTSILLRYDLFFDRAEAHENFQWQSLEADAVLNVAPGYPIEFKDISLETQPFDQLSLFQDYGDVPSLDEAVKDEEALALWGVQSLRQSLLGLIFEHPDNDAAQWADVPTQDLRHMTEMMDGAYPRLDADWSGLSPEQTKYHLHRIAEEEYPTAYEKLFVLALRYPSDEAFRRQANQLSNAEKRLFLMTLPVLEQTVKLPRLILCENPDERLFRENSEAFALLLREAGLYRPGTQWILSSRFSSFLDVFYPREVWHFKAVLNVDDEQLVKFLPPKNLGTDPMVHAMVEEGVPLSELAYGAYF